MLLYNTLIRQAIADIARRVPDMGHLDPERIAVLAAARCSARTATGNLATCYALRQASEPTFSVWVRPGTRTVFAVSEWFQYRYPRVRLDGVEMSYLIQLRLPRLLLRNPLPTLVHELYHIGERFDLSMRPERHGAFFNREVRRLCHEWLAQQHGRLARLAQMRLPELEEEFGAVLAEGVPAGFTIPIIVPAAAPERYERAIARIYPGHLLAARYAVRPATLSAPDAPRTITERDLAMRHVGRHGTSIIPPQLAPHSRRLVRLTA